MLHIIPMLPPEAKMEIGSLSGVGMSLFFDLYTKEIESRMTRISTNMPAEELKLAYLRLHDQRLIIQEIRAIFAKLKDEYLQEIENAIP